LPGYKDAGEDPLRPQRKGGSMDLALRVFVSGALVESQKG